MGIKKHFATILITIAFVCVASEPIIVPYVKNAPSVDGKLNDAVYKKLPFIPFDSELAHSGKSDIAIVEGESTKIAADSNVNRFMIFHSDNGLYITIVSPLAKEGEKLSSNCNIPDGLFEFFYPNDWIEIYIDPEQSGHDYYWFISNPTGNKTDFWAAADPDRSWNGVWKSASTVSNKEWVAEFYFPFATFNRTKLEKNFSLSMARLVPEGFKRQRWGGEFRMPQTWPKLQLEREDAIKIANYDLQKMEITDPNKSQKGTLRAEVKGTFPNDKVFAKWHIMRPMLTKTWAPEGNGPRFEIPANITEKKNDSKTIFENEIDIADDESLIACLAFYNSKNDLLWMSEDLAIRKQHTIGGPGCELNYYTSEKEINVQLLLQTVKPDYVLKAVLFDSTGKEISHKEMRAEAELSFSFDATSLPIGTYTLKNTLYNNNGDSIATRDISIPKYAPRNDIEEVKVSYFNRSIKVGENCFSSIGNSPQISDFGIEFGIFRMKSYQAMDFNTLQVWGGYYTIDKDGIHFDKAKLKEIFANAEKYELKVILYMGHWVGHAPHSPFVPFKFTDDYRISKVRELVNLVKDEKSLLAYEPYDEPEFFVAPEYLEKIYHEIKAIDPYHLVTLNGCRGARNVLQFLRGSDIVSIDYYPSGKWPAYTVVPVTEELVSFAGYKPVRWWIQSYQIFNPAPPTKEEIIAMTYMTWAHGTSAILYFIGVPPEPLASAQVECGKENLILSDAITAPYREKLSVIGSKAKLGVYASLRRNKGKTWIISVNQSAVTENVLIEIPNNPTKVINLLTNKEVVLKDGKLDLEYAPWERMIFEVIY